MSKKYDSYKDSGIEWIGEIPSHWALKKLKFFGKITLGKMLTPDDKGGYVLKPYLRAKNIEWYSPNIEEVKEMWFSVKELNQYKLYKNDLLVSEGGEVGRTCIWNDELEECYIQNSVQRVSFNNFESAKYFLNQFVLFGKRGHFDAIVNRISIAHLTKEKLGDVDFVYPPIDEQTAITNYLDQKTTQIDDLIAKKERLIQLLEEERTAIINQAVTKGLDPSVPMKDSGIEWLGKIPAHWEVKRIRYVFEIVKRIVGELGYEVLSVTQQGIKVKDITSGAGQLSMDYSKYQLVEIGDFVMNHMDLLTGYVDKSKYRGVTSPDYRVFKAIDTTGDSEFFLFFFQMCYRNKIFFPLGQGSAQAGRWRLPTIEFRNFLIPVPPIREQKSIIHLLYKQINEIDKKKELLKKEIQLLKEYKTALISEVVTGKIDVRNEKLNK